MIGFGSWKVHIILICVVVNLAQEHKVVSLAWTPHYAHPAGGLRVSMSDVWATCTVVSVCQYNYSLHEILCNSEAHSKVAEPRSTCVGEPWVSFCAFWRSASQDDLVVLFVLSSAAPRECYCSHR